MTRRRLGAVAFVLLLALVAGVWALPAMLDWGRYRDDIAALAAERLGRPVRIGGGVSLQLLPHPVLTAHDVVVEDTGDGIGLDAKALRLEVSLVPLLGGTIRANELVLQGAALRLPWPLPPALGWQPRAWLAGLRARVVDSRLQVGTAVLAGLDATLAADPDTGTLSVAGSAGLRPGEADGEEPRLWRFTVRLAQPGGDGAAGLDLSLDGAGTLRDTGATFSGQVGPDGGISGRVTGRGPDLSLLLPAPPQSWRGDGRLSVSGGLAVADELGLLIGGSPARGAVALRVLPEPRLDVSVAASRLDGDAWIAALVRGGAGPGGIPTGIDLSAEAATVADGTVRRLRGAVDLPAAAGDGIVLRDISAVLPGDATLALSGRINGSSPRFDGLARVTAPDLHATLRWARWLPVAAAALPTGALRTADVAAHVVADGGEVALTDLKGSVDGGAVSGTLSVHRAQRPGITADLVLGFVPLDAWLPGPASLAGPGDALARGDAVMAALRAIDVDLRLRADRADWGGVALGPAALELQADATRVTVRRLVASPPGARVAASGAVTAEGALVDGRLDVSTPELATLRPLLLDLHALPGAAERLLHGPATLSLQAAGPRDAVAGRITAEGADIHLDLQPVANLVTHQVSGAMTLHHPGAPRLLDALGVPGTAAWLGDGSLSLVGQIQAGAGRVELLGGTLTAGALRVGGRLAAENGRVTGDLVAETLPLPLPDPRSPEPLPFGGLVGWSAAVRLEAAQVLLDLVPALRQASAEVGLDAGVLTLNRVAGQALGGTLSGSATVDAAASPPRVTVRVAAKGVGITRPVSGAPVDLVAGLADIGMDLGATGFSPAAMLATAAGTVSVTVTEGTVAGFDLAAVRAALSAPVTPDTLVAVRTGLTGGTTPVRQLDATVTLAGGVAGVDGTLRSDAGRATMRGSLDLAAAALDATVALHPDLPGSGGPGPAPAIRLSGPVGRIKASQDLAGVGRWLAEEAPR